MKEISQVIEECTVLSTSVMEAIITSPMIALNFRKILINFGSGKATSELQGDGENLTIEAEVEAKVVAEARGQTWPHLGHTAIRLQQIS